MMADTILAWSLVAALVILVFALLITAIRVILGPTVADRVLALDQMVAISIGFIAIIAIRTGYELYIDIALALGLVSFLATAAFARYIAMARLEGSNDDTGSSGPGER